MCQDPPGAGCIPCILRMHDEADIAETRQEFRILSMHSETAVAESGHKWDGPGTLACRESAARHE
jgi:hypothetical protein